MDPIERRLLMAARIASGLGVAGLLAVAGLSVADIAMREGLGTPLHGAHDIAGLATIIIIASCFPAGLLERRQIQVRLLGGALGGGLARVLDTIGAVAMLAMFALIAWQVTRYASSVSASAEVTMVLSLPIAPVWWAASVCFWACVPAQLFAAIAVATGRPVPQEG